MNEKKPRRLGKRILVLAAVLVGLVWYLNASRDQDWLWFFPVFQEEASRIHLYRDGEQIVLLRDDRGYREVNEAINEAVRHVKGKNPWGITLADLEECYELYAAVEVFYTEPVIIHTRHGFPKADKYLFPQSGHHYDPPVVFAGMQRRSEYRDELLVLESRAGLDEAVDAVWAAHEQQ